MAIILSTSGKMVKGFMIFINIVTFMIGAAILGVGLWLKLYKGDYEEISSNIYHGYATPSNSAIFIGGLMIATSFLGCCGAITENRIMLLTYFIVMIMVIIGEIAVGAVVYVKRDKIKDDLKDDFRKSIKEEYGHPNYDDTTKAIDRFQDDFDCCGYTNFLDWFNSYYTNTTNQIPKSCCMDKFENDNTICGPGSNTLRINPYNTKGCYNEVVDYLKDNMYYIGSVAIAFAVIQILSVVLPAILYTRLGDHVRLA